MGGAGGLTTHAAEAIRALAEWDAHQGRARLEGAWLRLALGGEALHLASDDGTTNVLLDAAATLALIGTTANPRGGPSHSVASDIAYSGHGGFFDAGLLANGSFAWDPLRAVPALCAAERMQLPGRSVPSVALEAAWIPSLGSMLWL